MTRSAVTKLLASASQGMGSIPTGNKHLHEPQTIIPDMDVSPHEIYVLLPLKHNTPVL